MPEILRVNPITEIACEQARQILLRECTDPVHQLNHHESVRSDALRIIEREGLGGKLDKDIIKIASMWHDIKRHNSDHKDLRRTLLSLGADKSFIGKVVDVIDYHSFNQTPVSLEGEVVWDADKLQYVLVERIAMFLRAVNKGIVSEDEIAKNRDLWQQRVPEVPQKLHFDASRQIFAKRLEDVRKLIENNIKLRDLYF
jgi:HD superfamily phosphodiesterase